MVGYAVSLEVDQRRASDERRRANLEWLSRPPILAAPGPLGFDMSNFNGPDVWVEDDTPAVDEAIFKILLPKVVNPECAPKQARVQMCIT